MTLLTDEQRADAHKQYMADEATVHGSLTKADIRAAVNALDAWFDTNAATINAAIPQPARGVLTTAQKSRLVRYIIARRYG